MDTLHLLFGGILKYSASAYSPSFQSFRLVASGKGSTFAGRKRAILFVFIIMYSIVYC